MRISHSRITRTLTTGLLSFGLVACGLVASSMGQDDAKKDAALKELVVKALGEMGKKEVALSGTIEKEEPELVEGEGSVPQAIRPMLMSRFGGGGKPFFGEVDLLAAKTQEVVMVSKTDLPGLKVYANGEDVAYVQATSEGTFEIDNLAPVLAKLCAWPELAKAIGEATQIRSSTRGSVMEVRVTLDPSFYPTKSNEETVQGGDGQVMMIQINGGLDSKKVKEMNVIFTFSDKREITGIQYVVEHNAPESPMMMIRQAMPALRIQPAMQIQQDGANAVEVRIAEEAEGEEGAAVPPADVGGGAVGRVVIGQAAIPAPPRMAVQGQALPNMEGSSPGETILYDFQVQAKASNRTAAFLEEGRKLVRSRQ